MQLLSIVYEKLNWERKYEQMHAIGKPHLMPNCLRHFRVETFETLKPTLLLTMTKTGLEALKVESLKWFWHPLNSNYSHNIGPHCISSLALSQLNSSYIKQDMPGHFSHQLKQWTFKRQLCNSGEPKMNFTHKPESVTVLSLSIRNTYNLHGRAMNSSYQDGGNLFSVSVHLLYKTR